MYKTTLKLSKDFIVAPTARHVVFIGNSSKKDGKFESCTNTTITVVVILDFYGPHHYYTQQGYICVYSFFILFYNLV